MRFKYGSKSIKEALSSCEEFRHFYPIAHAPLLISSSASMLFPRSPSFASKTQPITSSSTPGNIWRSVSFDATAARSCARSISACSPTMSRCGVGVRETCEGVADEGAKKGVGVDGERSDVDEGGVEGRWGGVGPEYPGAEFGAAAC